MTCEVTAQTRSDRWTDTEHTLNERCKLGILCGAHRKWARQKLPINLTLGTNLPARLDDVTSYAASFQTTHLYWLYNQASLMYFCSTPSIVRNALSNMC